MADSSSSKPLVVTSSLSLKVTAPSFYNQPKKFASVAPPRPKSQSSQPSAVGTAVIGRVGEMPPPPPAVCEDFPPPPPPLDDAELPAPPPECQTTPPASEAPPACLPCPSPSARGGLSSPVTTRRGAPFPCSPPAPLPPPPPPLPAASNSNNAQRFLEKQTSFDRQLDSLTDMLSEMETRGPFNPKLPSQVPLVPAAKPFVPPPTAPKPSLSFLPPPELQDRPPPAPWAQELKLRQTNRHAGQSPAPAPSQPPPAPKGPGVAPKSSVPAGQAVSSSAALFGPKASVSAPPANQKLASVSAPTFAPKPAPASSYPPPPPPVTSVTPAFNHAKPTPANSQARVSPAAVSPQPKAATSPPSPQGRPMGAPASKPSASIPGGVPLSMKEVEELERMTQDFIKDMDTHAPVITSAPTEVCGKCGEALSRAQPAVRAMDKLFHAECFCCMGCHRTLQGLQFYDRDGQPQCEDCYVSSLAVCSLEGAPFITDDDNNPYCVPDYHRRFSPLCVSCNEPIVPDPGSEETVRVVALEKNFHLKCYRCEDCARPLSIEADTDGCYPLDGRILCMKCHTLRAKQAAQ
ncbi:hypothetical protein COCON_G00004670 [Conger conger]|uniref:Zyxin n=1 Tax=Conger conger TaxID=82655 RepID=A0A9Q1E1B9_CONCO|nr:hypothetical protein COCON_G00004670 [Conger conger]